MRTKRVVKATRKHSQEQSRDLNATRQHQHFDDFAKLSRKARKTHLIAPKNANVPTDVLSRNGGVSWTTAKSVSYQDEASKRTM